MPQDKDRQISLEDFEENRRRYYGLPKGMTEALKTQESGGRQYDQSGGVLTSPKQARGRYQVLKSTAAKYDLNPDDPFENVEASFRYLSDLNKQVDKNVTDPGERWAQTLAGYHAGEGRLHEVNKTGNLPTTSDGKIRTDQYVSSIMDRWQQHDQGKSGQQPVAAKPPQSTARRLGLKPAEGMRFDLRGPARVTPTTVTRTPGGVGDPFTESLADQGRRNIAEQRYREQERKPYLTQLGEQARTYLAEGGGALSKMARQTAGLIAGKAANPYAPPADIPEWRRFEEERNRELEAENARYRPTLQQQVARGVISGSGPAAVGGLLTAATGGGLPAAMAVGGGMAAAGADWQDPRRAALQTAIGAAAPVLGGMAGQRIGGAVANRLARPAAQAAARVGGEVLGGGAGNVLATSGEQLAFEGQLNPRELVKSGMVGAALSAPGAMGAARRGALPEPRPKQVSAIQPGSVTTGAEPAPPQPQPARVINLTGMGQAMGENLRQAWRDSVVKKGRLPSAERGSSIDRAFEAAVAGGAPRDVTTLDAVMLATQGAVMRQPARPPIEAPSTAPRQTAEIPRPVTAPTRRMPEPVYADAPETQQMPAIRERIAAENAPTRELPQVSRENAPKPSQSVAAPGIGVREEILAPPRPLTERLPVPKATDENIQTLRSRQEELGRLAYDRRGDFTGDLRDEYNQITAHIRDYENARAPREIGPPPGQRPEAPPNPAEREARRAALEPRTGPMPETLTPGRKVTQEFQVPGGLKKAESFISREDARQGHFERFNDQELVDEIRRMEDVRNQDIRGRSKLTPEQLKANRFDLKIATEMQKERRRLQQQIGVEAGERIAVRAPARVVKKTPETLITPEAIKETGRKIQHSTFGLVTEAPNQKGVPRGKLRVIDAEGAEKTIQNPRTRGNREAAFVRSTGPVAEPVLPMKSRTQSPDIVQGMAKLARTPSSPVEITKLREQFPGMSKADFDAQMVKLNEQGRIALHRHDHPASLSEAERGNLIKIKNDYFSAATIRERPGMIMGAGLGGLQPLFERGQKPKTGQQPLFEEPKSPRLSRKEVSETAGSVQAVVQLGNPRFVIRNILQHVAYGKQERTATRLAAAIDWAYSKASGQPRQVYAPRGSDLASYVRNWGQAIKAYKAGKPLPGRPNVDYATTDANKLDRAMGKVMTWINEIPDAANWQTRFEQSLQSITGNKRLKAPLDADAAIDQAMMEANSAALRDKNFASAGLGYIKKGLNKLSSPIFGTDKFGLGDFVAKYTQATGALLKRGLERSPLGLFQVAKEAATPGPFRRRNTLLALSRVAEGAATGPVLGAALAAAGVLVGPEEEKKAGKAMEREEGMRGYSLNASALLRFFTGDFTGELRFGDTLYSIDWLQPWAMNLSAGAALWELHKNEKLGGVSGAKASGEAIYNSLAKTLDVMGDQSVLKNLGRYMDKAQGETFSDKFLNFAKAIGLDVPSSFVPSSLRQARQVIDPFERDTRAEQRGGFGGFVEEAKNRALGQLPGVSSTFPTRPSLLTGEDRKTALGEFGAPARAGFQFLPANVSTYTPRPVAQEISRLNRAGEKVSISFPIATTNKRTGEREATSSLRGRERQFAETFSKMSRDLIADPFYKDADNETKAAAWGGLKRYLAGLGKEDAEEKTVDEIVEAAMEAVEKRREKEEK